MLLKYVARSSPTSVDFVFGGGETIRLYYHRRMGENVEEAVRRVLKVMNEVNEATSLVASYQAEREGKKDAR